MQNTAKDMYVGDALLFETPEDGILEVRIMEINSSSIKVLVSQVSPKLGLMGGYVSENPLNSNFTDDEKFKIKESIENIKNELSKNQKISKEQLDLVKEKLDDIQNASERLGRKDWIQYVMGSLTSLFISAAFHDETRKTIFQIFGISFEWLFKGVQLITAQV